MDDKLHLIIKQRTLQMWEHWIWVWRLRTCIFCNIILYILPYVYVFSISCLCGYVLENWTILQRQRDCWLQRNLLLYYILFSSRHQPACGKQEKKNKKQNILNMKGHPTLQNEEDRKPMEPGCKNRDLNLGPTDVKVSASLSL